MRGPVVSLVLPLVLAAALGAGACQYRPQPTSGQQQCAPAGGKRCPDGYYCAADDLCWKNGQGPPPPMVDAGPTPMGGDDTGVGTKVTGTVATDASPIVDARVEPDLPPPVPAPSSRALAAGATVSQSATYRAVRTLGQAPGGNTVKSSASYRSIGGLVGATQR